MKKDLHGILFLLIGITGLSLLVYSLFNLEALGLTLTHPRIIIEAGVSLFFLILGLTKVREGGKKTIPKKKSRKKRK
jgi:hypothetical protein